MSIWLFLSPLLAWLTFGSLGYYLLRRPLDKIWSDAQLTTAKRPYDRTTIAGRMFAVQIKTVGVIAIVIPPFITLMAILVALGFVSPAQH